jgi:hypothetical protein
MGALNVRQYRMAFHDLLDRRIEHLRLLATAAHHEPAVRDLVAKLDRLGGGAAGPNDDLVLLVDRHVDSTSTLAHLLEAAKRDPYGDDVSHEAAARLYEKVVAGRTGAGHAAKKRAEYAEAVREVRRELDPDLVHFPGVPGGPSFADRVDALVALGDRIGVVLSVRTAVSDAAADAPDARALVRDAALLVTRIRKSIRVELESDPSLPRDLETLVLGYVDDLKARPATKSAAADAPAP